MNIDQGNDNISLNKSQITFEDNNKASKLQKPSVILHQSIHQEKGSLKNQIDYQVCTTLTRTTKYLHLELTIIIMILALTP